MSTEAEKWKISLFSAVVFLVVVSPIMSNLIDQITNMVGVDQMVGNSKLVVLAVIFMLITRYSMDLKLFN